MGLQAKYPLFSSNLNKILFFQQIFEKESNMKFYGKPSSGSRFVGWGQADMTKLTVAFGKIICVYILSSVVRTAERRHIDALSK